MLNLGGTRLPGGLMVTMDANQGADLMQFIELPSPPVHYNDLTGVLNIPLVDFPG